MVWMEEECQVTDRNPKQSAGLQKSVGVVHVGHYGKIDNADVIDLSKEKVNRAKIDVSLGKKN